MKIAAYCQHVLGVGHVFRMLEICRALFPHPVTLITGGGNLELDLPPNVTEFPLPGLMMDADFSRFIPMDPGLGLDKTREKRKSLLISHFEENNYSVFLVELYPFGRKAFRFELDPVLDMLKKKPGRPCKAVSSVRDILVEKKDRAAYEKLVVKTLNQRFDAVFIHSDPALVRLDETFASMDRIRVPAFYTGYIAPKAEKGAGAALRKEFGIGPDEKLVVASAGSGSVGGRLLLSVLAAFNELSFRQNMRLHLFTGPYLDPREAARLQQAAGEKVRVKTFSQRFLSHLAAADLSVSLGGYNTVMGILSAGCPALVFPFGQNREQGMRAEKLRQKGRIQLLGEADLLPARLSDLMEKALFQKPSQFFGPDLNGAEKTANLLLDLGVKDG